LSALSADAIALLVDRRWPEPEQILHTLVFGDQQPSSQRFLLSYRIDR
jgi:hypothetical protein